MKYLKLFLLLNIFLLASFTASAATYNVKYVEFRNAMTGPVNNYHYLAVGHVRGSIQGKLIGFNSASSNKAAWSADRGAEKAIDDDPNSLYHDALNQHTDKSSTKTYLRLTYSTETSIDALSIYFATGHQSYANYDIRFFDSAGKLLLTEHFDMRSGHHNQTLNLSVPVPAAFFLFAPALLGFIGLRRSARKAKLA
jgi:hypothetical protein